jgi:hypothetical protein
MAGDGDQFSAQLLTENPRLGVAFDAGQGTAAHRAVYMDVAIGEKFRAGLTEETPPGRRPGRRSAGHRVLAW